MKRREAAKTPPKAAEYALNVAEELGWTFVGKQESGHRRFDWYDPAGNLHIVTTGSGQHSDRDGRIDAQKVRSRMRRCMAGACNHVTTQELSGVNSELEPTRDLIRAGDTVQVAGGTAYVIEKDGEHAVVVDYQTGEQDIVPLTDLQKVASFDPLARQPLRVSMAERSGDPEIDALIEAFLEENPYIEDVGELECLRYEEGRYDPSGRPDDPYDVEEWWWDIEEEGGWQNSTGKCGDVAKFFADWVRDRGYPFRVWGSGEDPDHPLGSDWDPYDLNLYGYEDRTEFGNPLDDSHQATFIESASGEIYMVDWTASQFGYREWPMVQRLGSGGDWERDWDGVLERDQKTASLQCRSRSLLRSRSCTDPKRVGSNRSAG